MFSRLYENLKTIIKENYKSIITLALCYAVLMFPVPYYITTGGGTINIKNRVQIEDQYESKGSLHLSMCLNLEEMLRLICLVFSCQIGRESIVLYIK